MTRAKDASMAGDSGRPDSLVRGRLLLGTAGWNVPTSSRERVGGAGSHLERYAQALSAVEINSSFYRPHRLQTYERWARVTPDDFRFSVKVPKVVTHSPEAQQADIDRFMQETAGLGGKLAVFLVQFPPGKAYEEDSARQLFDALQASTPVPLVCEPRHASWFTDEVDRWLTERKISRVAADPSRAAEADQPGGWRGLQYVRLHGSPRIYYSAYEASFVRRLDARLTAMVETSDVWCIFDNTAEGAAMENALDLRDMFYPGSCPGVQAATAVRS
ncbi:MAG TPA: DUF72 domain-containing protein [Bradyrhizobium sp.]|jgi:uncharacterized protein YecE (DUF72 family)|nr:DUF72 domain-containing protein [Bradyrhizobium sp.]